MSTDSAGQAKKMGYKNIKVYLEGEPAWSKAGYPLYASNDFISKGNIVLIDLRSVEKSEAGRIARSVTIPSATLKDKADSIPKKAPVVIYSDSEDEAVSAMKVLKEKGLKKVALVPGNIAGWVKSGGETTSGPVVTTIVWKRQMEKGEVSITDFLKVAEGSATDTVILDVRNQDETTAGMFKNAISIPLDQVGNRKGELPKDKKIYVHCTTGARAGMAAKDLINAGYNAFFLNEDISCKDNTCSVTE
jgi:rhodanese-related sulfurtransferase